MRPGGYQRSRLRRKPLRVWIAAAFFLAAQHPLAAQADSTKRPSGASGTPDAGTSVRTTPPVLPSLDSVLVTQVTRGTAAEPTRTLAGIGDVIIVSVRDLKSLVLRGSCLSADEKPVLGCNPQK